MPVPDLLLPSSAEGFDRFRLILKARWVKLKLLYALLIPQTRERQRRNVVYIEDSRLLYVERIGMEVTVARFRTRGVPLSGRSGLDAAGCHVAIQISFKF